MAHTFLVKESLRSLLGLLNKICNPLCGVKWLHVQTDKRKMMSANHTKQVCRCHIRSVSAHLLQNISQEWLSQEHT